MCRESVAVSRRSGFTLIEMLVSMVVLVLLIVVVSQMVNSTATLTKNSGKHMDSDSQARDVFDRLAVDIAGMVLRPDADVLFVKSTGNDKMFFYSETPAYFSGAPAAQNISPLSLIGYRVNANSTPPLQLERLGKGLTWTGTPSGAQGGAPVFLTYASAYATPVPGSAASPTPAPVAGSTLAGNWSTAIGTSSNNYNDGSDDNYRVLSSSVFRMEFCFLMKDGTFSELPYTSPHTTPQGMQDVSAIIVAIAILDDTSRKIVTSTSALVRSLSDFQGIEVSPTTVPSPLMATVWQDEINASGFAQTAGLPQTAASVVRVYQRYFYLHTK